MQSNLRAHHKLRSRHTAIHYLGEVLIKSAALGNSARDIEEADNYFLALPASLLAAPHLYIYYPESHIPNIILTLKKCVIAAKNQLAASQSVSQYRSAEKGCLLSSFMDERKNKGGCFIVK